MHLILDGFAGERDKLGDNALVEALLFELPAAAGMRIIAGPYVEEYIDREHPLDWGISGSVLIAESHFYIHTFPDRGILWFDAFSCKDFEAGSIVQRVQTAFGLRYLEVLPVQRGLSVQMGARIGHRWMTELVPV